MDYLLVVIIFQIVIIQEKIGEIVRNSNTGEKYISFYGGKYNVQRKINNKSVLFARFDNLNSAINHRDFCIKNNWDLDKCKLTKNTLKDGKYKHIIKLKNGSYQVRKKNKHYGIFNELKDAEKHRDYCVANDWDEKCMIRKKDKYNKYNLPKYITYNKTINKYVVCKQFNGKKQLTISSFKTLEDAIKERDLLIKCNWNEDELIHYDETFGNFSDGDYYE